MKILILTKKKYKISNQILNFIKKKKIKYKVIFSEDLKLKKKINKIKRFEYDYLLSILYPFYINENLINKIRHKSINFHPGTTQFPGFGCYNFAILHNTKYYGCTAHLINKKFDSGRIIKSIKFKISDNIELKNLINKTHQKLFILFKEVMSMLIKKNINFSNEKWHRIAYKRADFERSRIIDLKKDPLVLIEKKIQAFDLPGYEGSYIKFKKLIFKYEKK